jgi:tetratricopeptide (TPR) repeat protein
MYSGREALQAFKQALEIAEASGDEDLYSLALYLHGLTEGRLGHLDTAERYYRRSIEIRRRLGKVDMVAFTRMAIGFLLIREGQWPKARAEAEQAVSEARASGTTWAASYPLRCLGWIRLLQGERSAGLEYLGESLAMALAADDFQGVIASQLLLAQHDVAEGRYKEALDRITPLLDQLRNQGLPADEPVEALAEMGLGHDRKAEEILAPARVRLTAGEAPLDLLEVLRASVQLATRQGRWEDARQDVEDGLRIAREIGLPYDEALLLFEAGRMYQASGDTDRARESLMASLATFQRLGAKLDAARAEEALRALSPHPPAPSPTLGEGE